MDIYIKHPIATCNEKQEEMIANCRAEDREMHIFLFNMGNATYRYHQLASPTEENFKEWLEGLPENQREPWQSEGFERAKKTLAFTRYCNEKDDIGLEEYILSRLSEQHWDMYQKNKPD